MYTRSSLLSTFIMVFQKGVLRTKVLLILAYLIVLTSVIIARAGFTTLFEDILWSSIRDYFLCEAVGHVEGKCSRESFEKYLAPSLEAVTYIMRAFFPVVYLMFVINPEKILTRVREIVHLHSTKITTLSSTSERINHCKCQDWLTSASLLDRIVYYNNVTAINVYYIFRSSQNSKHCIMQYAAVNVHMYDITYYNNILYIKFTTYVIYRVY